MICGYPQWQAMPMPEASVLYTRPFTAADQLRQTEMAETVQLARRLLSSLGITPGQIGCGDVVFSRRDERSVWWQLDMTADVDGHRIRFARQGAWRLDVMRCSGGPVRPASDTPPLPGCPLDEWLLPRCGSDAHRTFLAGCASYLRQLGDPTDGEAIARAMGIGVTDLPLHNHGVQAELICADGKPQILCDAALPDDERRAAILHECVHACLHFPYLRFRQLCDESLLRQYSPQDVLQAQTMTAPAFRSAILQAQADCGAVMDMLLPSAAGGGEASPGTVVMADGQAVLNLPRYVLRGEDGSLHMTALAKAHPDRCVFTLSAGLGGALYRRVNCTLTKPAHLDDDELKRAADAVKVQANRLMAMLPPDAAFPQMLCHLMRRSGVTVQELSARTGICPRTIYQLRSDPDAPLHIEQLMRLSIGLQLPPAVWSCLMESAGLRWRPTARHAIFQQIMLTMYAAHPADVDLVLRLNREAPLFSPKRMVG